MDRDRTLSNIDNSNTSLENNLENNIGDKLENNLKNNLENNLENDMNHSEKSLQHENNGDLVVKKDEVEIVGNEEENITVSGGV